MEKKLKKQRRRIILRISAILLSVWLILSCAYALIAFNLEKKRAADEAQITFSTWLNNMAPYTQNPVLFIDDVRKVAVVEEQDGRLADSHISYTYDRDIEMMLENLSVKGVYDSDDIFTVTFTAETPEPEYRDDFFGFLSFSRFRKSLTDEQYEKILSYFDNQPQGEERYALLCTEFYQSVEHELFPKTVQIVSTTPVNKWYVQDTPVETFDLKPHDARWLDLHHISYLQRNEIPEEFVRNSFGSGGLIKTAKELAEANASESGKQAGGTESFRGLLRENAFEYIYYEVNYLKTRVVDVSYDTAGDDEEPPQGVYYSDTKDYFVRFAKRLNILEGCRQSILIAVSILLAFFLIIGVILVVMMWRVLGVQMLEEQKRRDMTNALAHDIKTPLFILSGYAGNLKENVQTEKRGHYADVIIEQAEEVNRRVNRMLELSRLDSPGFKPNKQRFDLVRMTADILSNYEALPDGKTVELHTETSDGACPVNADRELMKRAVENLVDNAVKYSDRDAVIKITITDRSFAIVNRCTPSKSAKQGGSGIGLTITKSVLELHGFKGECIRSRDAFTYRFSFRRAEPIKGEAR